MTARARKPVALPLPPTPEKEEEAFVDSLVRAGKAVPPGRRPLPPGATHRIVVTPSGAKKVKRKRFSAV